MERDLGDVIAEVNAGSDQQLYGTLAPMYKFIYERHFDYNNQLSAVQTAVPPGTTRVLEGGCGTGQLLSLLAARYPWVLGVDRNESMAAIARRTAPEAMVLVGDLATLCLSSPVDAIVMLGRVLPHATGKGADTRLLANTNRLLGASGVLVVNTFDRRGLEDGHRTEDRFTGDRYEVHRSLESFVTDHPAGQWGFEATYTIIDREGGDQATTEERMHLRAHSPSQLRATLRAAGFSEVEFVRESNVSLRATARTPAT